MNRTAGTLVLLGLLCGSVAALRAQAGAPRVRLGTYDNRAIAVAYAPSRFNPVAGKVKEREEASHRFPVGFTLAPGEQMRTRGDVLFGMSDPANGAEYYEGSLAITADGSGLVGSVLFGDAAEGRFATILALDGAPASELVFAHVAEGTGGGAKPYFTGLALYNPGAATVTADVEFYSRRGLQVGTTTLTLAPGARVARTAAQLVAGLNQIGGTMRVVCRGGAVSGFALYGDSSLEVLAVIPSQSIAR